jgi:hypothetical protein
VEAPAQTRSCPQCGAAFWDASSLTDHVLTAHGTVDAPAAGMRPTKHHRFLKVLAVLACLAPVGLIGLGAAGVFEKETVDETPSSVAHKMAVQLKQDGEIDDYRAVEPDDGWDTEYELDGDGEIRARSSGALGEEIELEAFSDDLETAMEDEARRQGFILTD